MLLAPILPIAVLGYGRPPTMMDYLRDNDLKNVRRLLKAGHNPTWLGPPGGSNDIPYVGPPEVRNYWLYTGRNSLLYHACYLNVSAKRSPLELVKELLKHGSDPNVGRAQTPGALFGCAGMKHPGVVEALCKGGANPNQLDNSKLSPLYWMIVNDRAPYSKFCIKELLEGGAAPDLRIGIPQRPGVGGETTQKTALHVACWYLRMDAVVLLIKHGANVNANSNLRQTPLHIAALKPAALPILKYLLAHNANPLCKDYLGRTPAEVALRHKNMAAVSLLTKKQGPGF